MYLIRGGGITIKGTSNSSKLTFSLGNGDIDIELPPQYSVNDVATDNGANVTGDVGAYSAYTFTITLTIPANDLQQYLTREIIVTDNAGNVDICDVVLEPAIGEPYLEVSEGDIELDYKGTPVTIDVDTNVAWEALQIMSDMPTSIEYVTFNNDKVFEGIIIQSRYTIECKFKRNNTSGTMYLYGVLSSPHTTTVSAYLTTSGSWRWGSTLTAFTITDTDIHTSIQTNGSATLDGTTRTFGKDSFTTEYPIVLGGRVSAAGNALKSFIGQVYYFRVKNGDTLLLNWIPARDDDGTEGFWDSVSETFVAPK